MMDNYEAMAFDAASVRIKARLLRPFAADVRFSLSDNFPGNRIDKGVISTSSSLRCTPRAASRQTYRCRGF